MISCEGLHCSLGRPRQRDTAQQEVATIMGIIMAKTHVTGFSRL